MINTLISIALGIFSTLAIGSAFGFGLALFPGVAAAGTAFWLLSRRTNKQIEAAMPGVQKALTQRNFDEGIRQLKALKPLSRWQFLVGSVLDAQIGMILYAYKQEGDAARPYLEKAYAKQWQSKAMLAALHFRRKRFDEANEVFEKTAAQNKKTSMVWAAWAYCESKRGRNDHAIEILSKGLKSLPDDEKLKTNLLHLQNNRKMRMKGYAEEWWALLLEKPPQQMVGMGGRPVRGGGRVKQRRHRR